MNGYGAFISLVFVALASWTGYYVGRHDQSVEDAAFVAICNLEIREDIERVEPALEHAEARSRGLEASYVDRDNALRHIEQPKGERRWTR